MERVDVSASVPPLSPSSSALSFEELDLAADPYPFQAVEPKWNTVNKAQTCEVEDLPQLQTAHGDPEGLDPIGFDGLQPGSFDLVNPVEPNRAGGGKYELEKRSELLFSSRHLEAIFDDPAYLYRFARFLHQHRPASVPLLSYYMESLKALKAINYSNAVLRELGPLTEFDSTEETALAHATANKELETYAHAAFELLAREDLPMYITHIWIQTVTVSIRHRIKGLPRPASEGLAEVFCLTDPSRPDNPIVFMTEEFNRTTQYGVDYVIGRNCRFLQGPSTNPFSVKRIRDRLNAGMEHYETFLNYRRDGSPFMNLVMLAPLYDSRGVIRYFLGAQVDVSGLARDCYGLGALKKLVTEDEGEPKEQPDPATTTCNQDEFTQLAELLGRRELDTVREHGGRMHEPPFQQTGAGPRRFQEKPSSNPTANNAYDIEPYKESGAGKHRVILKDPEPQGQSTVAGEHGQQTDASEQPTSLALKHNGRLAGVYENYVLVRPYPSLRILFTSPSMRMPGILQSPLLDRIGGSAHMRDQLVQALAEGQGVTAKVTWLSGSQRPPQFQPPRRMTPYNHPLEAHLGFDDDTDTLIEPEPQGRPRWLHCTPLVGSNGKVGVWMIVIVDDESEHEHNNASGGRAASTNHNMTPERRRPGSAMSDRSTPATKESMDNVHDEHIMSQMQRARPRRSSETLGTSSANTQSCDDGAPPARRRPAAFTITPRTPRSGQTTRLPARFFSRAALARAAASNGSPSRPMPGPATANGDQHWQGPEQHFHSATSDERSISQAPSWPLPPKMSSQMRRRREHQVHVPPPIREQSSERSKAEPHGHDNGETSSITSRGSAFTVRIEE
ncbi:hypothetical protein ACCO45_009653 [Purpureocillium lilacinum]|uniref:Uncharacterized protein n=1 Tax=Purpureocillium lilacinum TaxID=33203 RepID=A0ACC4DLU9_PURLI